MSISAIPLKTEMLGIDLMRFFAAMMVMVFHFGLQLRRTVAAGQRA